MDAVCFDMDGVLVDSEDFWIRREREEILPAVVPHAEVPTEEVTGIFYEELYDVLEEKYGVAVDYQEFVSLYEGAAERIYSERVSLTPGVRELVADLREQVPVAMVTASPPKWYDIVLDRFDLRFDATVSAADLEGPGKPEPAIYERAAEDLGVAPERTVAVEDSHHGTTAAARAGMTVIGFAAGDTECARDAADLVAETPEDLDRTLRARL